MERMSEAEMKIAEWVWANPGIGSMKLVSLCNTNYGWKQSTVFTLIKRMRVKGVLVNENAHLRMTIDRNRYYHDYARDILDTHYQGSLTMFLESCLNPEGVSRQEAGRLMNTIRKYTK